MRAVVRSTTPGSMKVIIHAIAHTDDGVRDSHMVEQDTGLIAVANYWKIEPDLIAISSEIFEL